MQCLHIWQCLEQYLRFANIKLITHCSIDHLNHGNTVTQSLPLTSISLLEQTHGIPVMEAYWNPLVPEQHILYTHFPSRLAEICLVGGWLGIYDIPLSSLLTLGQGRWKSAIDPNNNNIGAHSGHGPCRSTDAKVSWEKVASFLSVGTYVLDPTDTSVEFLQRVSNNLSHWQLL